MCQHNKQFDEWWSKQVDNGGEWTTLERLAAKDAWEASEKLIMDEKNRAVCQRTDECINMGTVCDSCEDESNFEHSKPSEQSAGYREWLLKNERILEITDPDTLTEMAWNAAEKQMKYKISSIITRFDLYHRNQNVIWGIIDDLSQLSADEE